jgi:hypothetical protein
MIHAIDEHHLHVGDQVWWGNFHSADREVPQLEWKTRQFVVYFESKWRVSVIWGYATYSDNHDLPWGFGRTIEFTETPEYVEAAVFHADREGIQPDGEPFGYLDAEQLNALLYHVSKLHTEDHFNSDRTAEA